jgi:hypothetical protein
MVASVSSEQRSTSGSLLADERTPLLRSQDAMHNEEVADSLTREIARERPRNVGGVITILLLGMVLFILNTGEIREIL